MSIYAVPCQSSLIISGINAKSVANTTIVTTLPNMRFVLFNAWLEATTLTGAATGPTFSIGTNSTTFNNLINTQTWSPSTAKSVIAYQPVNNTITVAPSTAIVFHITVGSTSTTFTIRVILKGMYY